MYWAVHTQSTRGLFQQPFVKAMNAKLFAVDWLTANIYTMNAQDKLITIGRIHGPRRQDNQNRQKNILYKPSNAELGVGSPKAMCIDPTHG